MVDAAVVPTARTFDGNIALGARWAGSTCSPHGCMAHTVPISHANQAQDNAPDQSEQ
jgi:hypothetical protein